MTAPNRTSLGDYIRKHRIASGLTLKDVARQLGVSDSFLCALEGGKKNTLARHRWTTLTDTVPGVTLRGLATRHPRANS